MYQEPIFLTPTFQKRIWWGSKLSSLYGYNIPNDKTDEALGECGELFNVVYI